jgi:RNase H-like domain found in reverse transcriptase/Integrase zinc binding domain
VAADSDKLQAIANWPPPTNQRQLRGFLGLAGYYRRFVHRYAFIVGPLTDLLSKDNFLWSESAKEAFLALKTALMTAPVLALPNFSLPFLLEIDVSGVGIGAVLMQDKHPIAFYSKKLFPLMQGKSTYIREMYVIQSEVLKWRQYLLGRPFVICTDHRSLHHLLTQTIQTPKQQQFLSKLVGYDFSIKYKLGTSNAAANALSRVHETDNNSPTEALMALSKPLSLDFGCLHTEFLQDDHTKQIIHGLGDSPSNWPNWTYTDGLLRNKGRLYLLTSSSLIPALLADYHSSPLGGHSGFLRTFKRLAPYFLWKGMRTAVEQFVSTCDVCQKCKPTNHFPYGMLQPLPIPTAIWTDLSMDFITHLPPSTGYTAILVVVDRLSKGVHLAPLPSHYTATRIAQIFWDTVGKLHGMPNSIVSN